MQLTRQAGLVGLLAAALWLVTAHGATAMTPLSAEELRDVIGAKDIFPDAECLRDSCQGTPYTCQVDQWEAGRETLEIAPSYPKCMAPIQQNVDCQSGGNDPFTGQPLGITYCRKLRLYLLDDLQCARQIGFVDGDSHPNCLTLHKT